MVERQTRHIDASERQAPGYRRPRALTFFNAMVGAAKLSFEASQTGDREAQCNYALEASQWAINLAQSPEGEMPAVHRRMNLMGACDPGTGQQFDPEGLILATTIMEGAAKVIADGRIDEIYPNNPFPPKPPIAQAPRTR